MRDTKRILVVDDDEHVLFVLSQSLERLGDDYHVITGKSAEEALCKAGQMQIDLLITDIKLPGADGIKLTEAFREKRPGLPVIWITGYAEKDTRQKAESIQISRLIEKPLENKLIRHIVKEEMEKNTKSGHFFQLDC